MPEEKRSHLQELLGGLTKNSQLQDCAAEGSAAPRWSLSDIDALLRDVEQGTGIRAQDSGAEIQPVPEQGPVEENTVVFEPPSPEFSTLPSDPSILTPEELGPAPVREDGMRFDLFQPQELESRLEGAKKIDAAPEYTPAQIEKPGITQLVAPQIEKPGITQLAAPQIEKPGITQLAAPQIEKPGITQLAAPQIEKPGVMLRRVDVQMTTDLSPVPRVVPADELLRQKQPEAQPMDIPEGQQRLPGFEEQAAAQALSDEELRRRLEKNKAQRTSQFTTLRNLAEKMEEHGETGATPTPEEPTEATPRAEKIETQYEYTEPGQRDRVFRLLRQARGRTAVSTLTMGVFAAAAIVIQMVSMVTGGGNSRGYLFAHAILLLAGLLAAGNELLKGARALFRRAPNGDTALLFAGLVGVAQSVLLLLPAEEPPAAAPCAALFLFQGTLHTLARWMQARHRCDNFRFAAYTHAESLYAVRLTDGRPDRAGSRYPDVSEGTTAIPVPVRFPGRLVRESLRPSAVDQTCVWTLPLSLGLAALVGASAGAMGNSVAAGFSAGAIALCLCMPAAYLFTLMSLVRSHQKGQANGIAILNTAAAEHAAEADAFALDSSDLYLHPKGRMHGWREYWQVRTDEVLLYAAAIAIQAGGPLQAVFEGVVEGDYAVLPEVHDLSYEDRMGLTCWIHNQKVFFGNRKLLENHGITVALTEKEEQAYEHDGRKIVYMAMEKRLAAFFMVSYAADPALKPYMHSLEKEDIQAKICSGDPCVTKDNICAAFDLRSGSAELLRAAPSQALRAQMQAPRETETAGIYHASNARAFLRALTACAALRSGIRRLRAFQLIGMLTSFLLLLIFALTKQMDAANNLIFIGYTVIWTAITYAAARS